MTSKFFFNRPNWLFFKVLRLNYYELMKETDCSAFTVPIYLTLIWTVGNVSDGWK